MGWDRKRRGPSTGYFYKSVRMPDKPHPVKVYVGRGAAGHEAAAEAEKRRADRLAAKKLIAADQEATAAADRLADALFAWAGELSAAWLVLTGHHNHKSCWRRVKHG